MTRRDTENRDVVRAFQRLTNAADNFVNGAPKVKRIEAERAALLDAITLDAITHAELVLSVHGLPKFKNKEVFQERGLKGRLASLMPPRAVRASLLWLQ
jgi:hypothetical protein